MTPPASIVAVTGVGAVSPWGWGVGPLWQGLTGGTTAIGNFDRFDHHSHRTHIAGQVPERESAQSNDNSKLSLAERFAVAAAAEATAMASMDDRIIGSDAAVVFASSTGGLLEAENYYYADRRGDTPDLRGIVSHLLSAPGEAVARDLNLTGPINTISSACASATLAIGLAMQAVRDGRVPFAIAGGADVLCRTTYGGFNSLRSVDEHPCRPFREDRQGLSLGEGGAALFLEPLQTALDRGAEPLALLIGAGSSSDAQHMTAPRPDGSGASRAIAAALADAGRGADAIGFVNTHGTGTPLNDAAEWNSFRRVFGNRAETIPVTATKGSIGHYLGAAGAIEAVATVLCLQQHTLHPTPAGGEIGSDCQVCLVTDKPVPIAKASTALSLNLGFGGCNAALVIQGFESA